MNDNVTIALARAGNSDPAVRAQRHADLQAHVPRMIAWLNDKHERGLNGGH